VVNTLTIPGTTDAWTGTVDIKQNYLVVKNGSFATISNQIKSGANLSSGYWDGKGIKSSNAAADFATAVGVASNTDLGLTTFGDDSTPVDSTDTLIRYTWYGDVNLDGVVDIDNDFIQWQAGFFSGQSGWFNGDYNYDGVVDIDNDFIAWQTGFFAQTGNPPGAPGVVPEPATLVLLGLGAVSLLTRRNRKV
jgi:hypothetical protein